MEENEEKKKEKEEEKKKKKEKKNVTYHPLPASSPFLPCSVMRPE